MPAPGVGRVLPLWLTVILGVAGTAAAVAGINAAAPILGPIVLAFVLTALANYLRASWGNRAAPVTQEDVAQQRAP